MDAFQMTSKPRVSLGRLHMGLTSARDKALMGGGLMRGDIDLMGDLTLIDYIINERDCYC